MGPGRVGPRAHRSAGPAPRALRRLSRRAALLGLLGRPARPFPGSAGPSADWPPPAPRAPQPPQPACPPARVSPAGRCAPRAPARAAPPRPPCAPPRRVPAPALAPPHLGRPPLGAAARAGSGRLTSRPRSRGEPAGVRGGRAVLGSHGLHARVSVGPGWGAARLGYKGAGFRRAGPCGAGRRDGDPDARSRFCAWKVRSPRPRRPALCALQPVPRGVRGLFMCPLQGDSLSVGSNQGRPFQAAFF